MFKLSIFGFNFIVIRNRDMPKEINKFINSTSKFTYEDVKKLFPKAKYSDFKD